MSRARKKQNSDWKDGFLFLANDLALDFLNTRPVHDGELTELIPDFRALLRWFQAAGLLSSRGGGSRAAVGRIGPGSADYRSRAATAGEAEEGDLLLAADGCTSPLRRKPTEQTHGGPSHAYQARGKCKRTLDGAVL